MGLFFGTDGLRGEFGKEITPKIAFKVGNAVASQLGGQNGKILIATDTRKTGDVLALSFASGVMIAGASVVFVGVCPTAGVSYLAKEMDFDYGVVISASHNSAEFNGIKIFDKNGKKLNAQKEKEIEQKLLSETQKKHYEVGRFLFGEELVEKYVEFLKETTTSELENGKDFSSLKIVLDTANGAASKMAGRLFKSFKAEVLEVANTPNGTNINRGVGVMNISNLQNHVLKNHADFGFAYDGDSDRVIAVSGDGRVVDGDQIVYIFARDYLEKNKLKTRTVVGTKHTNLGIEKALNKLKIELMRTDIGDKFVLEELEKNGHLIGGEQSGHVIVTDKLQTGDGVLNSLLLTCLCVNKNKTIGEFICDKVYYQKNVSVKVRNKNQIILNDELQNEIKNINQKVKNNGRLLVRPSGTEQVIRIMSESEDEKSADYVADSLEKLIKKIDARRGLCVE